jgi:hypothetical protein
MFTLAMSFLVFSASSFALISILIEKAAYQALGSDIYVSCYETAVFNEVPMSNFLDSMIEAEGSPVWGYTFTTFNMADLMEFLGFDDHTIKLRDPNGYGRSANIDLYGVSENYLNVTDIDFYYPMSFQDIPDEGELSDGQVDAVSLIYNREEVD